MHENIKFMKLLKAFLILWNYITLKIKLVMTVDFL